MGNKVFKETYGLLTDKYGAKKTEDIMNYAKAEFERLCLENANESKEVKVHTVGTIYPCISIYRGIINSGESKEDALEFMDFSCSKRAEKKAKSITALLKIPKLHRLYPKIFSKVAVKQFGEAAGFKAKFYETEKTRSKFDMTQCLYCDVCRKNGCFELTKCFCHTDDVCNESISKNLCWNRTKTMGEGGDICDFDIYVIDKNK